MSVIGISLTILAVFAVTSVEEVLECHKCIRLTVTDDNGQSGVDEAVNASIGYSNNLMCDNEYLTSESGENCSNAEEICVVMETTFTLQYNGATVSMSGQNSFCDRRTLTDPIECEGEGGDEFKNSTKTLKGVLENQIAISNVDGFSGHLCKCNSTGCNTDTSSLLSQIPTTTTRIPKVTCSGKLLQGSMNHIAISLCFICGIVRYYIG